MMMLPLEQVRWLRKILRSPEFTWAFRPLKLNKLHDNLAHIAHNVVIGRNTAVIANAMIGGSVVVGENTWIAPSASIRDQVTIGNNVTIGMSSLVTKSIPNDEVWIGSPAKKLR